ncbi:hypothetical protein HED55_15945 [Ochrobactrum haematophilum]|uniref:Uncharacterized protein n=1 Tax=Brucella haematophila TaxID=419474 RepID=A0ABX1DRL4_9HYPH|nr:hypothetical protein [Brucella haematophila]
MARDRNVLRGFDLVGGCAEASFAVIAAFGQKQTKTRTKSHENGCFTQVGLLVAELFIGIVDDVFDFIAEGVMVKLMSVADSHDGRLICEVVQARELLRCEKFALALGQCIPCGMKTRIGRVFGESYFWKGCKQCCTQQEVVKFHNSRMS